MSSEKYEAQYSRTSAPTPAARSTMSSPSASRRRSTETSYAGIHGHDEVTDPPDAAVFHCVAAHTVAAAGGSARTTKARLPSRRTSGRAHAARTKWQTMSVVTGSRRASGAAARHDGRRAPITDISPVALHPYGAPRRPPPLGSLGLAGGAPAQSLSRRRHRHAGTAARADRQGDRLLPVALRCGHRRRPGGGQGRGRPGPPGDHPTARPTLPGGQGRQCSRRPCTPTARI